VSGPVDPTQAHSFVLFLPSGVQPPAIPWADELSPTNPTVPRWLRLDPECHGDRKIMPRELYALVCAATRDADAIIHAFLHELALPQSCDEALLVVNRANRDDCELYTKQGAPLLLAAVRSPSREARPLLQQLAGDDALREIVERKARRK
jgi:hypothetical protein